jgi:FkbM family methyltransferase
MDLDLSDHLQRAIAAGAFELGVSDVTRSILAAGDTVIDVGANVGFHTLQWSKRVGPSGRVLAFEPVPPNMAALRRNLALNPALKAETYDLALGHEPAQLQLNHDRFGWTSGGYSFAHAHESGYLVKQVALDHFLEASERPIVNLSLIKVDVEGFEAKVLSGALETVRHHRPYIVVEWHLAFGNSASEALRSVVLDELVGRLGYSVRRIEAPRGAGLLTRLPRQVERWPKFCELLLIPSSGKLRRRL